MLWPTFIYNIFPKNDVNLIFHKLLYQSKSYSPKDQSCPDEFKGGFRDWSITGNGLHLTPYTGKGERVAILDTGVDIRHKELYGSVKNYSFIKGDNWGVENAHGTFIAGQILPRDNGYGLVGVAPEATALSCKVLHGNERDRRNNTSESISNAIKAAVLDGCGVISLSLGGPSKNPKISSAISNAVHAGCLVIAAAGNESLEGSPYASYPASYYDVISVGAADKRGYASWYSTVGHSNLNKYAQPEVGVSSLEYYWSVMPNQRYGKMLGTSMACPVISGVALLWLQAQREKETLPKGYEVTKQFRKFLKENSSHPHGAEWNNELGYGVFKMNENSL